MVRRLETAGGGARLGPPPVFPVPRAPPRCHTPRYAPPRPWRRDFSCETAARPMRVGWLAPARGGGWNGSNARDQPPHTPIPVSEASVGSNSYVVLLAVRRYRCHPLCNPAGDAVGEVSHLLREPGAFLPVARSAVRTVATRFAAMEERRAMEEEGVVGDRRPMATGRGAGLAVRRRHHIAQLHKRAALSQRGRTGRVTTDVATGFPYRARRDSPLVTRGRHQGLTSL